MKITKLLESNIWLDRKQELLSIFLIMVTAFLLRIYKLGSESLWHDEAFVINMAKKPVSEIIGLSSLDVHPYLHYIISHFWIDIFGDTEIMTRFLSVIFGVLSVYVIYRFGKLLFNKEIGILSAFVLSISLFHIKYSQEMRSYSLLVLLVLLSNYYFIKILKEKEMKITNKSTIGYIISTVAVAYTHVFGLFYIILQNIYYIVYKKDNRDIKFWAKVQGLTLLLFSPWIPTLIDQTMKAISNGSLASVPVRPGLGELYNVLKLFSGNDASMILLVVICIVGLVVLRTQEKIYRHGNVFILMWLFVPIVLSFIISQVTTPVFYDRYLIASLPAMILLVSYAMFNFQKYSFILLLLVAIVLVSIPSMNAYYQNDEKEQWRGVAQYIENNRKDGDVVLIYPEYGKYGFDYYYKNLSDIYVINGSYEIKNNIRENNGIWFVSTEWWRQDSKKESKQIERELSRTYAKTDSANFIDVSTYYYNKSGNGAGVDSIYLYQKNHVDWNIVENGAWGILEYTVAGTAFDFSLNASNLMPNVNYTMIYGTMLNSDKSELESNSWKYIRQNLSDNQGNISITGSDTFSICSYPDVSPQIVVRLVLSDDYDTLKQSMARWNADNYLYEDDVITCSNRYKREVQI